MIKACDPIVCRATSEAARVLLTRRDEIVVELATARERNEHMARRVVFLESSVESVLMALIAIGADPAEPTL